MIATIGRIYIVWRIGRIYRIDGVSMVDRAVG